MHLPQRGIMDLHQNIRTDSLNSFPWRKWADVWWGVSVPLCPHPEIQNCLGITAACCYDIHNLEMEHWIFLMASQFVQLFTTFSVLTSYYFGCNLEQSPGLSWVNVCFPTRMVLTTSQCWERIFLNSFPSFPFWTWLILIFTLLLETCI